MIAMANIPAGVLEASSPTIPWSAAVFSSRESTDVLMTTVRALRECGGPSLRVDVLVNGQRGLAEDFLAAARRESLNLGDVKVWFTPYADKAHAWNEYVHRIWDGRSWAFNVDGYVTVLPGGLHRLRDGLLRDRRLLASTGTPTAGRSSASLREAMQRDGGLHGNLFLMTAEALGSFRSQGIRLPTGLYRTDSTIGAVMAFGMDPRVHEWASKQYLLVDPDVTWHTPPKVWWHASELRALLRRSRRQAQGVLENRAVRYHLAVKRRSAAEWPSNVWALIDAWREGDRRDFLHTIARRPLAWHAWQQLHSARTQHGVPPSPAAMLGSTNDI